MKFYSRNVHNKKLQGPNKCKKKTNIIKTKVYFSDHMMHGLKHTFPTIR
jgi:hypothetical protein